jgi:hypothetical protein
MRALVAILVLVAGCVIESPPLIPPNQPQSVRVRVMTGMSMCLDRTTDPPTPVDFDIGAPDARRPFTLDSEVLPIMVEVIGPSGDPLAFDGWLEARIEPGEIVGIDGGVGPHFRITGGTGIACLQVRRVFSDARVWVEDVGFVPADPATARCANDADDDGDGAKDHPADSGCRFVNDDSEEPGSHAIGVSDVIFFANPRLADTQGFAGQSPLAGRRVVVSDGEMIVTRITTDGFYVSEIDRTGPVPVAVPWGSMFVFNFNTPPFLRACDRILEVSGSIGEFFGFTELNQPSWESEWWCPNTAPMCPVRAGGFAVGPAQECPIPEPFVIDSTIIGTAGMEQLESALVRIENVQFPTKFGPECYETFAGAGCAGTGGSNCDLNGDGDVNLDPGEEDRCNDACSADIECAEWNQFTEFGQVAVQTAGGVINLVTRDSVSEFDPVALRGMTIPSITGTLRHFAPIGLERGFILEPRCEDDIVLSGSPIPSSMACVFPRTGGPDDPM